MGGRDLGSTVTGHSNPHPQLGTKLSLDMVLSLQGSVMSAPTSVGQLGISQGFQCPSHSPVQHFASSSLTSLPLPPGRPGAELQGTLESQGRTALHTRAAQSRLPPHSPSQLLAAVPLMDLETDLREPSSASVSTGLQLVL